MSDYFRRERVDWIIEIIQIYGFINREHVERKFGVSTPQASMDLQAAIKVVPRIEYDTSGKRYILAEHSHG